MDTNVNFFLVARGRGSFPHGQLLRAPRYPRHELYRRQFYRQSGRRHFLRDGVGRDRLRRGPMLAIESLATLIGCGWRRVEGRGVSIAIDGAYMTRKKVRIARGTGRHARSDFCQAIRGLAIMLSLLSHLPSCLKCKL